MVIPFFMTPEIYCDHNKLERCLQNLIRNAIYFCNSYCIVSWTIQDNKDFYVEIIDDGKGVSPEIQDKIFEWRITGNKIEGTGVGLSYVKFVADIHGGSISYFRRNDLTHALVDSRKLRRLGWRPRKSVWKGLWEVLEEWREKGYNVSHES